MNKNQNKSISRTSFTAHYTGYTWYANGLSHKAFSTGTGCCLYYYLKPFMWMAQKVFRISGMEISLLHRHLIIDHLLEKAIDDGVTQVIEIACGLSPRGYRFMNNDKYREITYIEADLPGIVKLKRDKLKKAGHDIQNHLILDCDILSLSDDTCLENITKKYMNPEFPTAIITEGLINYFQLDIIISIWQRISNILKSMAGGVYLSDNLSNNINHPNYKLIKLWTLFLSGATRGTFNMHFDSDLETEKTLKNSGFNSATIHHPESYEKILPISKSKKPSLISVIEANF